ncbi:MAG: hypothetical protein EOP52_07280 [Sphingobacteriales bacterium]|nr:MAG: hypothetical protein EOP52_07280 [Sphingobacteriales bacterium]
MKWIKKGLLFNVADQLPDWAKDSALQPCPLKLNETTVRFYCGFRDEQGVSRVGYVDIQKQGHSLQVIGVSEKPVLNIGSDGCFDDNGVVPSCIVRHGSEIRMYYAGYQLVKKVRFLVLGGLAISTDGGESFIRYQENPVLERTQDELLFRVAHSVLLENNTWRAWYGGGSYFEKHGERTLPVYDIRYMESPDGISFPQQGTVVLENAVTEHRVGRPFVYKAGGTYYMFFGSSTKDVPYRLTYAVSTDSKTWTRKDIGLEYQPSDFDSEMSAYPSIVELEGTTFLFYNGNDYGAEGFGYAVLEGSL